MTRHLTSMQILTDDIEVVNPSCFCKEYIGHIKKKSWFSDTAARSKFLPMRRFYRGKEKK